MSQPPYPPQQPRYVPSENYLPPQGPPPKKKRTGLKIFLASAATFVLVLIVVSAAAGSHNKGTPAAAASSLPSPAASSSAAPARATAAPSPAHSAVAKMTAAQTAAMSRWYSGATVVQAANVCGDVYRVYSDNVAVNSGTGSSSLEGDITTLQTDVAAALSNPPPVAADAVIWKRVLNAYSNTAGDGTNSGLVAAVRSAQNAAWTWTPSFGGTLLVCLNVNI